LEVVATPLSPTADGALEGRRPGSSRTGLEPRKHDPTAASAADPGLSAHGRFTRAEGEWRGRIAAPDNVWPCMQATPELGIPQDHCTNARACVQGQCVPCLADSECLVHETCVLGHCLLPDLAECHTRADCEQDDDLCALTKVTPWDPRGNSDLRSYCLSPWGGDEPTPEQDEDELARQIESVVAPGEPSPSPSARAADLLRQRFTDRSGQSESEGRPPGG
jgi:hypothetical protein